MQPKEQWIALLDEQQYTATGFEINNASPAVNLLSSV